MSEYETYLEAPEDKLRYYLKAGLTKEATKVMEKVSWDNGAVKKLWLANLWSIAIEQTLTTATGEWLEQQISLFDSLPHLRANSEFFRKLTKFNSPLLMKLADSQQLKGAPWILEASLLVSPHQELTAETLVNLWNKLYQNLTKSRENGLAERQLTSGFATAFSDNLQEENFVAANWILQANQPQYGTALLKSGLNKLSKDKYNKDTIGEILNNLTLEDIEWNELMGYSYSEIIQAIRSERGKETLETTLPKQNQSPKVKLHL